MYIYVYIYIEFADHRQPTRSKHTEQLHNDVSKPTSQQRHTPIADLSSRIDISSPKTHAKCGSMFSRRLVVCVHTNAITL